MKRLALMPVLLLVTVAFAADTSQFKNPAVRDAHEKYEAAKRGFIIALERGINQAKRDREYEQAEMMQAHLDALKGVTEEVEDPSVRDFARFLAGKRYDVGSGTITFERDGSFAHSHRSWGGKKGSWKPVGSDDVAITTFDGRSWHAAFTRDRKYLLLVLEQGRTPEGGTIRR